MMNAKKHVVIKEEKMATKRFDLRIPDFLLKQIEDYRKEKGIATKTAAFLELVREGLESTKTK